MVKRSGAKVLLCTLVVVLGAAYPAREKGEAWPQWAQNSQHTGFLKVKGQELEKNLVNLVYDPLVPAEMLATGGDLLVHYQTPLVDDGDVYMMSKSGTFSDADNSTQRWHQDGFKWQGKNLVKQWTHNTDWVAPGSLNDFWEPVYHAALANGFLYGPGAGGTIFKVNRANGAVVTRINPFGSVIDAKTYTASPLSVDEEGSIYYNVVRTNVVQGPTTSFYDADIADSWLVKVGPDDAVTKVSYSTLLGQARIIGEPVPGGNATTCKLQFPSSQLPWPPSPTAVPATARCGTQRAALNVAPAIGPDGTIYTVSRAHFATRYNYLIAVNPDLTGKWASSLRGHLKDGCHAGATTSGSILPKNGDPGGCRVGAPEGVDPGTNEPGPGRVLDDASSTPTVAPDGTILFGAYTRYNYAQGHLMQFSADGAFMNAFDFGWDSTPAIYAHDDSYSIITKNNHYSGIGSYCNRASVCPTNRTATNPASPEAYFVTQLSPTLGIEWSFQNTNTQSCKRNPDDTVTCVIDGSHPNSFEWCVNAPAVDKHGVVYANSEDGFLYAINQGGTMKQSIFQQLNLGAAYTPASLGSDGKVYSQNAGHMFVVGRN